MHTTTARPVLVAAIGAIVTLSSCQRSEPTSVRETEPSPSAFEVSLICDGGEVTIVGSGDALEATLSGTTRRFHIVEAASGTKYRADDSSVLWNKGDEWALSVDGSELVTCAPVTEPQAN